MDDCFSMDSKLLWKPSKWESSYVCWKRLQFPANFAPAFSSSFWYHSWKNINIYWIIKKLFLGGNPWSRLIISCPSVHFLCYVFISNFRILTGHGYLLGLKHLTGVINSLFSPRETMNFSPLTSCANYSLPGNFFPRAELYWIACREVSLSTLSFV